MSRTIVLMGGTGAGKTTVGRELAALLGEPFVDVDARIEAKTGRRIREIFAADGEPAFRALEVTATLEALKRPGVVALGGGAPMTPAIAEALRNQPVVVWLQVTPELAAKRVGGDPNRPLLRGADAPIRLKEMLDARTPTYAALATLTIEASHGDSHRVARELARLLGKEQP
ncbi:MAG: shikimate kinase [Propionibacteriaceae bacterium]|nr:shikimate kinase [Micropruina sp.]HBX80856.1 shikimate kinase [Propionibacteriaceae bacterium]HBY22723.1 shikimate kinase [Propionibacteriaceae bacterium]